MPSFKHILFPVDFSEQNSGIAPYVQCMARRYGARVTMLHAVETPVMGYMDAPVYSAMDFAGMMDDGKQRVGSFLKDEFQDIPTTRLALEGDPSWRITEYADREKVDLIMMPTHGYGPFRRFLLGSVTAKVLHDVKCPVWTSVHKPEKPAPPAGYRNVLCAVDVWSDTLPLLRWASLFACEQGATLKLLHAIPAIKIPGALGPEDGRFQTSLFDMARQELRKLQQQAGTSLEIVVEGGEVAHVVHRVAEASRCDLVVIGRGVIHELFGRMRTNVYSIIRDAPCPVISV
jgi:nucleotide-binding universal stress UspA family protein